MTQDVGWGLRGVTLTFEERHAQLRVQFAARDRKLILDVKINIVCLGYGVSDTIERYIETPTPISFNICFKNAPVKH
jgi:hypothetical protein